MNSPHRPAVTPQEVAHWRRLKAQGMTIKAIAQRTGRSRTTISQYLAKS